MLSFKDASLANKSKRLRWFGINREDKQKGVWKTTSPRWATSTK